MRELVRQDVLLFASLLDELAGQCGAFARRHHPADDVAAEDVENDVEVKVGPLGGTAQFGDVPTPQPIGRGGQQLRFLVLGMSELIAAFARCAVLFQNPIHGSRRAKILAFIEQSGLNGGGRAILEAHGIEHGANRFAFVGTQRPGRSRASDHGHGQRRTEAGWR